MNETPEDRELRLANEKMIKEKEKRDLEFAEKRRRKEQQDREEQEAAKLLQSHNSTIVQ